MDATLFHVPLLNQIFLPVFLLAGNNVLLHNPLKSAFVKT
jgi:hypothetical protein